MSKRRILCLWFPRLGAERLVRTGLVGADVPLAVVADIRNTQVVCSLNQAGEAAGIIVGQPVRDAHAMCGTLMTKAQNRPAEDQFLAALRRWAGKFSPWVAEESPDGLIVDLTGCAHLFGGEEALCRVLQTDCADLGLSVRLGVADTVGAAWALARYAGSQPGVERSGDAIDQEARATRSRSARRRHWAKGAHPPEGETSSIQTGAIAPPGNGYGALSPLPVAALRLDAETIAQLGRLGLRRVGDLLGQPRAALARRFGKGLVLRLDQAMGSAPEPVSPARPPHHFAIRMTFPEPIGLEDDILAAIDRMLPRLCAHLAVEDRGLRSLRLEAYRTDHTAETVTIGLARPGRDPHRIRPLLAMKLGEIDAGFGIDMLRLEAVQTEPLYAQTVIGHRDAGRAVNDRLAANNTIDDLIGRLGARVGLDAITRLHPASSHIPEKTAKQMAAAWSTPAQTWSAPPVPRPLCLWSPEPVQAQDDPRLPAQFRWRGRDWDLAQATGPERIAPEWWLDDPNWRTGVRDYWVVTTRQGDRLWFFYGHGGTMSSGWFCQGSFA